MIINKDNIEPMDSLHFGDINNDGFPDLLGIFKEAGFKKVYLLINTYNETSQKR